MRVSSPEAVNTLPAPLFAAFAVISVVGSGGCLSAALLGMSTANAFVYAASHDGGRRAAAEEEESDAAYPAFRCWELTDNAACDAATDR